MLSAVSTSASSLNRRRNIAMSPRVLEAKAREARVQMSVKFLILCVKGPRRKSRLIEFQHSMQKCIYSGRRDCSPAGWAKPCRNFPSARRLMIFPEPRNQLGIIVLPADRTWKLRTCREMQFLRRARARGNIIERNVRLLRFNMFAASVFSSFGNNNLRRTANVVFVRTNMTLRRRFNYGDYYLPAGHSPKFMRLTYIHQISCCSSSAGQFKVCEIMGCVVSINVVDKQFLNYSPGKINLL